MGKYSDMYPIQDKEGRWVVVRVCDGHIELTPWTYTHKDSALRYCMAHGFCL